MPLYEYECDACGHRFEVIQKFSDAPIEKCPKCQGTVHKLIASPAFQFKGSGWYVTDYARKDAGGGAAKKESGETSKKDDAKTESKPESKAADTGSTPAKTESKTTGS